MNDEEREKEVKLVQQRKIGSLNKSINQSINHTIC